MILKGLILQSVFIVLLNVPVQEINSKERDQFWLKEEQEEKKRIEAERKRREEV